MSTQIASSHVSLASPLRMLWRQLQVELIRLWRTPSFLISSLLLPVILYSVLGGFSKEHGLENGVSIHDYALASVGTYCIVSVMLYSFGTNIANERAQRVNVLMRATPLPPTIYLLAKVITALLSALVMLIVLSGFAFFTSGVQLSATGWITLIGSLLLGVLPFIMLGFTIGNLVNPTGVTPLINLSFFILAFASGIFVPLAQLPGTLQNLAPYSPFYRLAQLAWNAVGVKTDPIGDAIWILLIYALIFSGLALFAYTREERRSFG